VNSSYRGERLVVKRGNKHLPVKKGTRKIFPKPAPEALSVAFGNFRGVFVGCLNVADVISDKNVAGS